MTSARSFVIEELSRVLEHTLFDTAVMPAMNPPDVQLDLLQGPDSLSERQVLG
jgi:hypothetical protein